MRFGLWLGATGIGASEATILAAAITVAGAVVGVVAALATAEISRRQRAVELFYKSLEFLGGGTQKRNLGVAAIQLYAAADGRLHAHFLLAQRSTCSKDLSRVFVHTSDTTWIA